MQLIYSFILFLSDGLLVNRPGVRHSSEPRKRFPNSGSSDEDPYSLTPSGSSGSSGKGNHNSNGGNSRIPPGEKEFFGPQNWAKVTLPFISIILCLGVKKETLELLFQGFSLFLESTNYVYQGYNDFKETFKVLSIIKLLIQTLDYERTTFSEKEKTPNFAWTVNGIINFGETIIFLSLNKTYGCNFRLVDPLGQTRFCFK